MDINDTPDWKSFHVPIVIKAAQAHPIFGKIGTEFIKELSSVSTDRIYMPGDMIIEEGSKGDSLFIMVSGQAMVYTQHGGRASGTDSERKARMMRIGTLIAGSISGELAMLGIAQKRSASVEAETICAMWEISHEKAMPIIDRFPDSRDQFLGTVCSNLEHTVTGCIDAIALFKKFDRKFRMLIGLYCERRAFFPGEPVFVEGQHSEGLSILNFGMASLSKKGIPMKTCSPGAHFNSTVMLGIHKLNFCTLTATHTCHVIFISRNSYVQALEQYPTNQVAQEMAKHEQIVTEDFREKVRRACPKGLHKSHSTVAKAFKFFTEPQPDIEIYRQTWKVWTRYVWESMKQRRERESRKNAMHEWIHRQREAVAHRTKKKMVLSARKRECEDELPSISPPSRSNKYSKLSTLYLGSRQDWEGTSAQFSLVCSR
jgi:CRP-like cAMP-binding protein